MEAYCIKCKGKREMIEIEESSFKNGTPILKGKCVECKSTLCRIVSKKGDVDA